MELREPTEEEKHLITHLIGKVSAIDIAINWRETLLVLSMADGEMGSLRLFPKEPSDIERQFGSCVSDCSFKDTDGVDVIASLYVDQEGQLFELDIWKTDFSSLVDLNAFHKFYENSHEIVDES